MGKPGKQDTKYVVEVTYILHTKIEKKVIGKHDQHDAGINTKKNIPYGKDFQYVAAFADENR
ncbi:hypothetical protein D3C87_1229940 [compost metagenome]